MYPVKHIDTGEGGDCGTVKKERARYHNTSRHLRADAAQNRKTIIEVADKLFAERGLAVTMSEIAAAAGVGRATLHRNFATRIEIALALFRRNLEEFRATAAAQTGAPGDFEALLDLKLGYYVRNGGLAEAIQIAQEGEFADSRREVAELMTRAAQRSGAATGLRSDLDPALCEILQMAMSGVLLSGGNLEDRQRRADKFRALLLQGLLCRESQGTPAAMASGF